jgi:hypothetical protein
MIKRSTIMRWDRRGLKGQTIRQEMIMVDADRTLDSAASVSVTRGVKVAGLRAKVDRVFGRYEQQVRNEQNKSSSHAKSTSPREQAE